MGKILILDEHPSVRELTAAELGDDGHLVVRIGRPSLIKELINTLLPDLLLLDLHLCGVDRWDVLEAVKKEAPHLPVLIFTAFEGCLKDARMALADGYVMKSFCFERLKQKVAEVLKRKLVYNAEGVSEAAIKPRVPIPKGKPKFPLIHWGNDKTLHA